jgi:hypothetical protein
MLRVPWELQQGRQAEARDDLLAAFTLGRNVSRDGTLISVEVQMSIENGIGRDVAEHFGQFTPETLKQLVEGVDAAPARRTTAACIPSEMAMFRAELFRKTDELQKANPGDDAKTLEALHDELLSFLLEPETDSWERMAKAAGGTSQGVMKQLTRDLDAMDQKLAVIATLPYRDFENQMKAFRAEIHESSNPLVQLLVPEWEDGRRREFGTEVCLAMVHAAVEYKLHGDSAFQRVADPCGQGPFLLRRFVFEGVDRGFQLTSALAAAGSRSLIFVEKEGDPFWVYGRHPGEAYK